MRDSPDLRKGARRETELLLESAQRLRATLEETEETYRQVLRRLDEGGGATETVLALGADAARSQLTDAVKDFEHRRHRARVAMIAVQLQEGESIGAIGRSWGFSRQLASVYASEARSAFGSDA